MSYHLSVERKLLHATGFFVLVLAFVGLLVGTVNAAPPTSVPADLVTSRSPSVTQSTSGVDSWHNLILSDHGRVESVEVGMYFRTPGAHDFRVNVSQWCGMRPSPDGTITPAQDDYIVVDIEGRLIRFTGREVCNPSPNNDGVGPGTGRLDNTVFTIRANEIKPNFKGTTLFGARVQIRWVGSPGGTIQDKLARAGGGEGSRIRFRFRTVENNARVGYINTANSSLTVRNNSMVHPSGGYANKFFPFGFCRASGTPEANKKVSVYDADNGLGSVQSRDLGFFVATINPNPLPGGRHAITPLDGNDYQRVGGSIRVVEQGPSRSRQNLGHPLVDRSEGYPIFYPSNFQNKGGETSVWISSFRPNINYVLVVVDQHAGQFIYVGLPGDAIFGSPADPVCGPGSDPTSLRPEVSLSGDDDGVYAVGSAAIAGATVVNGGGSAASANWTRRFWYERNGDDTYSLSERIREETGTSNFPPGNTPFGNWPETISGSESRICTRLELRNANPATTTLGPPAQLCLPIAKRPYFQVFNGDAIAAAVFEQNGVCDPTMGNGQIRAYNKGIGGGYAGSGSQVAAFAATAIQGFTSGSRGAGAVKPKGLSFANTDTSYEYGGSFDGVYCIPEADWAGATPGNRSVPAVMLNPADPPYIIRVEGDVYIQGNITYNAANFNRTTMPYVKIVAGGNIYISGAVTELNGIFAAKGDIYTCAVPGGSGLREPDLAELETSCGQQLIVKGSVTAEQVHLLRVFGDVTTAIANESAGNPRAAEQFIFSPEVWMAAIYRASDTPNPTQEVKYDAITTLPPVL